MNRKQKIVVSVTGIFLVLLILVGLTYAYFLTQIVGNTNTKSISVTTANLKLTYGDGTTQILTSDTKLIPSSTEIGTKDFTVTNNGDATSYVVLIENVVIKDAITQELTTFNSNDFVYTLECTSNKDTCNGVSTQTTMPLSDALLVTNDIEEDEVHTYTMTVWYLETNKDQSSDMNKTLEARINIEDSKQLNPYSNSTNSLAYNIINNALNVTNDQINDGYAAYRSTPLTKPGEEISFKYIGINPTSYSTRTMSTTYQEYYYVYSDTYSINSAGQFILDNPQVIQYSVGFNTLKGKYITSTFGYSSESTANTNAVEGKTFSSLYKVGETTTLSTLYYGAVSKTTESVESTLSVTPDDYTYETGYNSYYYRGGVENNYVNFDNKCWRVVRIEGDGSVKLTLASYLGLCNEENTLNDTSAFIGMGDYGYKEVNSSYSTSYNKSYIADFDNSQNRETSMKHGFETFVNGGSLNLEYFDVNLVQTISETRTHEPFDTTNLEKMKSSEICIGDVSTKYNLDGSIMTQTEIDNQMVSEDGYAVWYYDNYIRINNNNKPTLLCNSSQTKTNATKVFPLTIDEFIFSGAKSAQGNYSFYMIENSLFYPWWTISLRMFDVGIYDGSYLIMNDPTVNISTSYPSSYDVNSYDVALKPTISLVSGTEISSGTGTQSDPYVIK